MILPQRIATSLPRLALTRRVDDKEPVHFTDIPSPFQGEGQDGVLGVWRMTVKPLGGFTVCPRSGNFSTNVAYQKRIAIQPGPATPASQRFTIAAVIAKRPNDQ